MVKKKVGNRVYITTEPKVAIYVPTEEDILHGKHGTKSRTMYENTKSTELASNIIRDELDKFGIEYDALAIEIGVAESILINITKDYKSVLFNSLVKVCNYLNLELKDLL